MRARATTTVDVIDSKKLLKVLSDYKGGDFSARLPVDQIGTAGKITVDARGEILQIKDVFNEMVDRLGSFASEVTRVAKEAGSEGSWVARPTCRASPAPGRI